MQFLLLESFAILTLLTYLRLDQFPDPWRRSKHKKRLIVQPGLVALLRKYMPAGAAVYLSSDCKLIAESMREQFLSSIIDMAGSVSVDEDDEEDDSNVADKAATVTVTSSGGGGQFRLVREADLPQQVSRRSSVVVDGDDSRENPLLLRMMDENAFLCKSTLMQTPAAQDGSGDGWISFNPLVRCSPLLFQ